MAGNQGRYPSPNHPNGAGPYPGGGQENEADENDVSTQLHRAIRDGEGNIDPATTNAPPDANLYGGPSAFHGNHQYAHNMGYTDIMGQPIAPQANMGGAANLAALTAAQQSPAVAVTAGSAARALATPAGKVMKTGEGSGRRGTKSSRACDACRNKKIRCDKDPNSPDPCSNCKKGGDPAQCIFSREPQKRGPNKGYIRDLSDRVAAIEGRRPDQGSPSPLPAALPVGRKRSSEAADLPAAGPGERRPPAPPLGVFNPQNPTIIKIQDPAMARTPVAKSDAEPFSADEVAVLEQYYQLMHANFPVLPAETAQVHLLVSFCKPELRDAFIATIKAGFTPLAGQHEGDQARLSEVREALNKLEAAAGDNPSRRPWAANLLYLHGLLFGILAVDSLGNAKTQSISLPSLSSIFGKAVDAIHELKVDNIFVMMFGNDEHDKELFAAARRLLWALRLLDVFKAMGDGTATLMPTHGPFIDVDRDAIGDTLFELARLARCLHSVLADVADARTNGGRLLSHPRAHEAHLTTIQASTLATAGPLAAAMHAHAALYLRRLMPAYRTAVRPDLPELAFPEDFLPQLGRALEVYAGAATSGAATAPFAHHFVALPLKLVREGYAELEADGHAGAALSSMQGVLAAAQGVEGGGSGWSGELQAKLEGLYAQAAQGTVGGRAEGWAAEIIDDGYLG